jgi:HEPN domain-containing protein
MPSRYIDWFNQAKKDLKHAENSLKCEDYEWACFSAQQSAEKATKSVFMKLNKDCWGHSVNYLLMELSKLIEVDRDLIAMAKQLDKDYILARYPNGFDIGTPFEYYSKEDAKGSIKNAGNIIKFCESIISK